MAGSVFLLLLGVAQPALTSVLGQAPWDAFNRSISGRLFDGIPMMSPCFDNYNGHQQKANHTRCAALRNENSPTLYFGGYQNVYLSTQIVRSIPLLTSALRPTGLLVNLLAIAALLAHMGPKPISIQLRSAHKAVFL